MRNIVSPLEGIRSPFGPRFGTAFSPASLFAAGEQGVWYDPSDFTTMFQDSAGTIPVTAVEQPVGRILDKSGRGNHAFQSTSASRPVLSARVNLLTKTEQFDDAVWMKTRSSITSNVTATTDPLGGNTADKLVENNTLGDHFVSSVSNTVTTATGYTFSCYAKAAERTVFAVYMSGVTATGVTSFNLSTGATIATSPNAVSAIVDAGNGWYLCSVSVTTNATASIAYMYPNTGGTAYQGNGTSGIYIWGADFRVTNDGVGIPAYQRVNTSTDYDTTGFPYYLRFDGTDDSMATGTITPGIDKVQVFAGVRKLSDVSTGTVVQLSSSTSTNNGTLGLYAPFNSGAAADYAFISKGTVRITVDSAAFVGPESTVLTAIGDIAGPTATLLRNGTQIATSSSSQGTGNFGSYALNLGTGAGLLNGRLYSLILRFGANLDATTITNTETWVNGKTYAYA
jgi:hypothetical protein